MVGRWKGFSKASLVFLSLSTCQHPICVYMTVHANPGESDSLKKFKF